MPVRRAWWIWLLLAPLAGCYGDDFQRQLNNGLEMVYEGAYQDAEVYFLALARRLGNSDDPQAREWRARALLEAGRVEHLYLGEPRRAVARLREAMKLGLEGELAFKMQLEIAEIFYTRLHDYRNAALEFERLVNLFEGEYDTGPYRYRIAQCYFTLRQFDQARAEARLLVERYQNTNLAAEGMLLIANSYYVEGRYREAAQAHQKLLDMNPGDALGSRSLFELGLCHQQLGELRLAEKAFLAALRHHPRPDIVQIGLAQVREQMTKEGYTDGEEEGSAKAAHSRKQAAHGTARPEPTRKATPVKTPATRPAPRPAAGGKKTAAGQRAKPAARKQPELGTGSQPQAKTESTPGGREAAGKSTEKAAEPASQGQDGGGQVPAVTKKRPVAEKASAAQPKPPPAGKQDGREKPASGSAAEKPGTGKPAPDPGK